MTQEGLSEKSKVSLRSISNYENGELPNLETLFKLAEALGVAPGYFLGEELIERSVEMHDKPHLPGGIYSHWETETLMKSFSELAHKLPKLAPNDRKHVLGNLRSLLDELEDREHRQTSPGLITAVTKHGIVRQEHSDLRGVSSTVAERAKKMGAAASEAVRRHGGAEPPLSSKAAATTGNKDEPSAPSGPGSGPVIVPPKKAPK